MQRLHGHLSRNSAHTHYMESPDEAASAPLRYWHPQSWILVSLWFVADYLDVTDLHCHYSSVICGICKAVFMLTTGGDPDNTL